MRKVTKLVGQQFNDDDLKPMRWKITRENQGERFFISWKKRFVGDRHRLDDEIDWLVNNATTRLQKRSLIRYRLLCEVILLNLGRSMLSRSWVQIPRSSGSYSVGTVPHSFGFSKRHVDMVLNTLKLNDLIYEVKGAKYERDPQLSAYQPTELFDSELGFCSLLSVEPFDDDYVRITKSKDGLSASELSQFRQDSTDLKLINDFLQDHDYPLKGPVKRIYSRNVGLAGRLYCDFQTLSRRVIPVRQGSLIDGESIAEIDIVASHPRMAIQKYHNEKISPSFYHDISEELAIPRERVKKFFQVALSSSSTEKARAAYRNWTSHSSTDYDDLNAMEGWLSANFSRVPLYQGISLRLMNYEGELLKQVMLKGVSDDVVVLPIHDAIAVKHSDVDWGMTTMKSAWKTLFGNDYCELDVSYY